MVDLSLGQCWVEIASLGKKKWGGIGKEKSHALAMGTLDRKGPQSHMKQGAARASSSAWHCCSHSLAWGQGPRASEHHGTAVP